MKNLLRFTLLFWFLLMCMSNANGQDPNVVKPETTVQQPEVSEVPKKNKDQDDSAEEANQTQQQKKEVKEVKGARPDMQRKKGARRPQIERPAGAARPAGAGRPAGVGSGRPGKK